MDRIFRASLDAGITAAAKGRIPVHFSVFQMQRPHRAHRLAPAAANTTVQRFGVVAIAAVKLAALEKDRRSVAGAVHKAMVDHPVYISDHRLRTFRSYTWQFFLAPMPRTTVSFTT